METERPGNASEAAITSFSDSLEASRKEYGTQRRWMFRNVRLYKYGATGLALLSTVVLGLETGSIEHTVVQKNIALVIGALLTALSTLALYWNIEEYWLRSKVIEEQLDLLKTRFDFERSIGLDSNGLKVLFSDYQAVLGQQNAYWKGALDKRMEGDVKGN